MPRCLSPLEAPARGARLWSLAFAALLLGWAVPKVAAAGETPAVPTARAAEDGSGLSISLATFGPGDEIHQLFGHNALLVQDRTRGPSHLFNYGMFSFGPDMLPQYLMGRLVFWSAATPLEPTVAQYIEMRRDVRIHELNLPPAAKTTMLGRLLRDVQPQHREYLYHHYFNNCSTRVRDVIDEALHGQLRAAGRKGARYSFRGHTRRYASRQMWFDLLLLLWMNDSMERPIEVWHEAFLPDELERQVLALRYTTDDGRRVPLVSRSQSRFDAGRPPVPTAPPLLWPFALGLGLLAGGAALVLVWAQRKHVAARWPRLGLGFLHILVGGVWGIPALLMFLMAAFTEHAVIHHNENLWFANILTFMALPLGIGVALGSRRMLQLSRWSWYVLAAGGLLAVGLKPLPAMNQENWIPMALYVPLNLGFALALRQQARIGI